MPEAGYRNEPRIGIVFGSALEEDAAVLSG
jgi:hypothetical protein